MSDSTSILDLPTDPVGGGNMSNNISLSASENINLTSIPTQGNQSNTGVSLDQSTISQIVSSLQQATLSGATKLASRDIPMTTTIDPQIQPNYIPPPPPQQRDYIHEYNETSDIINEYNKNMKGHNSLDDMYSEIQTPLLLAVLYFLFQLPFIRKNLFHYIPILFSKDGNLNINGFIFTSALFGFIYYILNKITYHFSVF